MKIGAILRTTLALFAVLPALKSGLVVIGFEDLNDGESVTAQCANLVFENATVLTAGISLTASPRPGSRQSTGKLDRATFCLRNRT